MDVAKCNALKAELAEQAEPNLVPIERFFDGNDDEGSIGCNLSEHPGMDAFRETLCGLLRLPNVEAVYAQIAEIDPAEGLWPFSDTVFVVGTISAEELAEAVRELEPSSVGGGEDFDMPPLLAEMHDDLPVLAIWWD